LAEKPDVRGGVMATSERCGEGDGGDDRRNTYDLERRKERWLRFRFRFNVLKLVCWFN